MEPIKLKDEIYEPEHERGVTCWCKPKIIKTDSVYEIIHTEERKRIPDLINKVLSEIEEHASHQDDNCEIKGMLRAVKMIKDYLTL